MNSKSEWAANRDNDGIVYCFADGTTQVIRLEDYLRENPEYTAEDFRRIKEASDALYYERFQSDVLYGNKTTDTDFDAIADMLPAPEPEPCLKVVHREQRRLAVRAALTLLHSDALSPVQKKRFISYFLHGKSISEIARKEMVNRSSIWRGLRRIAGQLQQVENC